jgi:hypothetical protein
MCLYTLELWRSACAAAYMVDSGSDCNLGLALVVHKSACRGMHICNRVFLKSTRDMVKAAGQQDMCCAPAADKASELFSSTRQQRFLSLLRLRVTSAAKGLSDATSSSARETTCWQQHSTAGQAALEHYRKGEHRPCLLLCPLANAIVHAGHFPGLDAAPKAACMTVLERACAVRVLLLESWPCCCAPWSKSSTARLGSHAPCSCSCMEYWVSADSPARLGTLYED